MVGLPPTEPRFRFWSNSLQIPPRSCTRVLDNCPVISVIHRKAMEARLLATTSTRRQFRHERPVCARTKKMSLQRKGLFIGVIVSLLLCVVLLGASHKRESEKARNELKRLKINYDERSFLGAALDGNTPVVALFLKAGMNPNTRDVHGATPLLVTAAGGRMGTAEFLLSNGAASHAKANNAGTDLRFAIVH